MNLKITMLSALMMLICMSACNAKPTAAESSSEEVANNKKVLVCYFSATGTTAEAARRVANLAGADLYEIVPATMYTDADLDWRDSLSRSSVEMHDLTSRPAIAGELPDLANYEVVLIGYPNWWNTHPTIINTFIETNDLKGKTVAPFMTSGGSTIANSEKNLKESYPELTFAPGLLMNDVTDAEVVEWVNAL